MGMFQKATLSHAKMRLAMYGASGSGKTWTALMIATQFLKRMRKAGENVRNGRIALIDTEFDSACEYAEHFDFDRVALLDFSPQICMRTLEAAANEGYPIVIFDQISSEWAGEGGILELVDKLADTDYRGNKFAAWGRGTPLHNRFVNALLKSPFHLICTMRAKTEWHVSANEQGKAVPQKIGVAPVARADAEYEFGVMLMLDQTHAGRVMKTRGLPIDGMIFEPVDTRFADLLADHYGGRTGITGDEFIQLTPPSIDSTSSSNPLVDEIRILIRDLGLSPDAQRDILSRREIASLETANPAQLGELYNALFTAWERQRHPELDATQPPEEGWTESPEDATTVLPADQAITVAAHNEADLIIKILHLFERLGLPEEDRAKVFEKRGMLGLSDAKLEQLAELHDALEKATAHLESAVTILDEAEPALDNLESEPPSPPFDEGVDPGSDLERASMIYSDLAECFPAPSRDMYLADLPQLTLPEIVEMNRVLIDHLKLTDSPEAEQAVSMWDDSPYADPALYKEPTPPPDTATQIDELVDLIKNAPAPVVPPKPEKVAKPKRPRKAKAEA